MDDSKSIKTLMITRNQSARSSSLHYQSLFVILLLLLLPRCRRCLACLSSYIKDYEVNKTVEEEMDIPTRFMPKEEVGADEGGDACSKVSTMYSQVVEDFNLSIWPRSETFILSSRKVTSQQQ